MNNNWTYELTEVTTSFGPYSTASFVKNDGSLKISVEEISSVLGCPLDDFPHIEQLILGEPSMCHSLEANRNAQGVYDWADTVEEYAPDGLTEEALRKHCERNNLAVLVRHYLGYNNWLNYALIAPVECAEELVFAAQFYEAWLDGEVYDPVLYESHTIRDEVTGETWQSWYLSDFQPSEFGMLIRPTRAELEELPDLI